MGICEECGEAVYNEAAMFYDDATKEYLCDHCAYERHGEAQGWDYPQ
jgi:formylmethanofuran dehydrogenase subunit E